MLELPARLMHLNVTPRNIHNTTTTTITTIKSKAMNSNNDDRDYIEGSPMAEDEDEDDEDAAIPVSKKRARVTTSCASSAAVPASVRRRVIASANSRCWLCSQHGKHVAHVVARSDRILVCSPPSLPPSQDPTDAPQFDEFRRTGLLHMASLHSFDNLVFLCHGCHGAFDERIPAWAFLPTPLTPFLTAELAFHAARAAAALSGTRLLRPAPAANPPPLLYARYQIRRGHVFTQVFRKRPTRLWAGNPVAAIIRSASVLMGVQRLDPVVRCGVPDDVGQVLQRLLWLYGTPPPKVVDAIPGAVGPAGEGGDQEDSLGEEGDGDSDEDDGDNEPDGAGTEQQEEDETQPEKSRSRNDNNRGEHDLQKHPLTPPSSKKVRVSMDDDEAEWVFGPTVTAQRMVDWYCATRDA